jgi:hydrogenase/urease accessory protein HupE
VRPALTLAALLAAGQALAHDARPLAVTLVEQTDQLYRVVVRAPPSVEPGNTPAIVWPDACEVLESAPLRLAPGATSLVRCLGGLAGQTIRIDYPAYNPSITTLFRLETTAAGSATAVLPPDLLAWTVPAEPSLLSVARDYTRLGFRHIWEGLDHLLFVAGLMLLARWPRRIVWAVTGFTAAHSLTLSLAALGAVRVPLEPVEAMIALSILFLAGEIARGDPHSFSRRYPLALSFVFGLLHGFGFASALGEIGLPRGELAAGLAFFNIGVELGQLAFIAVAAAAVIAGRRLLAAAAPVRQLLPQQPVPLGLLGAYGLGIPAAFWAIERTATVFGA